MLKIEYTNDLFDFSDNHLKKAYWEFSDEGDIYEFAEMCKSIARVFGFVEQSIDKVFVAEKKPCFTTSSSTVASYDEIFGNKIKNNDENIEIYE